MSRLRSLAVGLTLAMFLHGCASQAIQPYTAPAGGDRTMPRDIVVTAAQFPPEAKLDLLLRSKAEVAGAGAGSGAAQGAGALMQGMAGCTDGYCLAAALLLLPVFMGVGAVVGAAKDAPEAATPETIASGQRAMQDGIEQLDLQRSMQAALVQALQTEGVARSVAEEWELGPVSPDVLPQYASVRLQRQDAILEVSVLEFQFRKAVRPEVKKLAYRLALTTRVRLLAPASRAVLDELVHLQESEAHSATDWLSHNAQLFASELNVAIRQTAGTAVHEMFLLYYPPAPETAVSEVRALVPEFVLRPEYPLPERTFDLRGAFLDRYRPAWLGLKFVPVEDIRPTFKWEAFPRPLDVAGLGGQAGRLSAVRYELVIHEARYAKQVYEPGAVIYRRTDLLESSHRVEQRLQPCGRYFWTVRAHFRLDGWPRVTEWMGAYGVFPTLKPWEARRGIKAAQFNPPGETMPMMMLPFCVPSASGGNCD